MVRRALHIKQHLKSLISTRQGKNLLTFAIFVLISALFWFLMTLNDNVERDYKVHVIITDIPEDINFVISPPEYINVNVRGKGSDMVRYDLLGAPDLRIKFDRLEEITSNSAKLSASETRSLIRKMFSSDAISMTITPDSIKVSYTTAPGVRVPVKAVCDVSASVNHIVFGTPVITPDSVTLYSVRPIPDNIKYLTTVDIQASNLSDSLHVDAALNIPEGMRVDPDEVSVIVPVEPLVSRKRSIPVEPVGVPAGYRLSTFPATVSVTVMVPMSLYSSDDTPIKAYADYEKRAGNTVPLKLSILPEYYRNATLDTKRVEFILERDE